MGWAGLLNGDLLDQAEKAGIEVFVTSDQNIPFQQNLAARPIAVVVLATNRWSVIQAEHVGAESVAHSAPTLVH